MSSAAADAHRSAWRHAVAQLWAATVVDALLFGVVDLWHARGAAGGAVAPLTAVEMLQYLACWGFLGAAGGVAACVAARVVALLLRARPPFAIAAGMRIAAAVGVALVLQRLGRPALPELAAALAAIAIVTVVGGAAGRFVPRALPVASAMLLLSAASWLVPATVHGAPRPAPPGAKPDVVVIVLDTQRPDFLGAYGDTRGLSPNFDALARESTLFRRCYANAPWTVPSHASLFTLLEAPSHGCSCEHHRWLDSRFTTLAEALASDGVDYQCAGFAANDYLFEANLDQGFAPFETVGRRFRELALRPLFELAGFPARFSDHGGADAVARVSRFLADERDPERPLFLFINLLEVHWRNLPPFAERLSQCAPDPGVVAATRLAADFYGPLVMAGKPVAGDVPATLRRLYAAATRYQDRRLGELLALLRERLDLARTLLVVTADHGENLGEAGRYDHVFAVNDHLLHVPLLIRDPARFAAGAVDERLVALTDVGATVAAATHVTALLAKNGEPLAGRSLLAADAPPRDHLFAAGDPYFGHLDAMSKAAGFSRDVVGWLATLRCVHDGRFKLVRSSLKGDALYDLATDPDETSDVSAAHPEVVARLRAALDAESKDQPTYIGPPRDPPLDDDRARRKASGLDQIGY